MLTFIHTLFFQLTTYLAYRMLTIVLTFLFQLSASLAYRVLTLILTPFLELSACLAERMLSAIVTLADWLGADLTGLDSRRCWLGCRYGSLLGCGLCLFWRLFRLLRRFCLLLRFRVLTLILALGNHFAACLAFLA